MPKTKDVSILDVTIRDGSYAIGYKYTTKQVASISKALDVAGIDYIEVSHGCGLGAAINLGLPAAASDAEYVLAAKGATKHANIGVIAGAIPITKKRDIDSIIEIVDFIRFAANCNNPEHIKDNASYTLKQRPDLPLFLQLMRSSRCHKKEILKAARWAEDFGFAKVYLVDTAGHYTPDEVIEIISLLTAKLSIEVGFHGHDNLNLAVANSIAAVTAGAQSIDASLKGIGRSGGNAQLEALVSLLKRKHILKSIDLDAIIRAGQELITPIMPPRRGTEEIDLITADANIDIYPIEFCEQISAAKGISLRTLVRELGKNTQIVEAGPQDIERAAKKLGRKGKKKGNIP